MKLTNGVAAVAIVLSVMGLRPVSAESGEQLASQGNANGATACSVCHGPAGMGNAATGFPRLAGLNADYLKRQLVDYQSGARRNPIMEPVANALDSAEISAVTRFYAEQDVSSGPLSGRVDREPQSLGERLATRGAWERNIPECVSCHGPEGIGTGAYFPRLAGQHASYIVQQINAWKQGTRENDPNQLMGPIAERLSDEETAAVADYFAGALVPDSTK